ncbi:DUF4296 domain-containing protein [Flagellimonas aquimarina]|jgi:hypothetical protein|uniref:DUF4296 domain-containing protein n=1 Tax=Flagellimonas aquimarina TaxID=2201895 RepID=A0A316L315_9FLAO|nr:DUF4296 domain-containing protein [Allomuricauda koreensis]PWL40226.1 DUF4296 domain-containing protein [Allomuricauda koreensis]
MRKVIALFFLALFFSCGKKIIEKPENLIPQEKMVEILHDLAILNSTKSSFSHIIENRGIKVMDFLYEKHRIDSAQFSQSDLYYASVPLEYQAIYEKVEMKLDTRKATLENATKKRNDSAKKALEKRKDSMIKPKID